MLLRGVSGLVSLGLLAVAALAEPQDFSGIPPAGTRWSVHSAEGPYRIDAWNLQIEGSGQSGEAAAREDRIRLVTADATVVELARALPPLAVIDELELSLEVNGSRPGIRMLVDVVLPHSLDPKVGQAARATLYGPIYTMPGSWERLILVDLPRELQRSIRAMQLAAEPPLDARGAYVERVRLSVRPGRGETTLGVRDVQSRGAVSVEIGGREPSGEYPLAASAMPADRRGNPLGIDLDGGVLHMAGRPLFPWAVERWDGPLRLARDLGFNIVVLDGPPTPEQEREAEAADIWLIATPPAPDVLATTTAMSAYPRVIAWRLGTRLTTVDLEGTSQWAALVRRRDPVRGRPLLASVSHGLRAFSRVLDIVVLQHEPMCGPTSLSRFADELDSERRLVMPGKAVWMTVPTRVPDVVLQQALCLARVPLSSRSSQLVPDQVSRLVWMALSRGMLGLIFDGSSLAGTDADNPVRIELKLLSGQLDLIHPLLAETGTSRRVIELGDGLYAGVLTSGRTHCVLPWRQGPADQIVPPDAKDLEGRNRRQVSFVVSGITEPSEAYLLSTSGTRRLAISREAGGVRVLTEAPLPRDVILMTQDAVVTQRLRAQATANAANAAELERALDAHKVSWQPNSNIDLGGQVLRSSPLDRIGEFAAADSWLRTIDIRALPTPNLLPGGDFEGVEASRQAGWQHVQLDGQHAHEIELVTTNVRSGSNCVRIYRSQGDGTADVVDPGVWLASPRVPLQEGDVIRLSGWIRGTTTASAPAWALVEDTLGGAPLALKTPVSDRWQPFVLYRATDTQHEWSVRLASCGAGEVFFDGLIVQRVPAEFLGRVGN